MKQTGRSRYIDQPTCLSNNIIDYNLYSLLAMFTRAGSKLIVVGPQVQQQSKDISFLDLHEVDC